MTQFTFPGLKPPRPTIRTPRVAKRIAERIVAEVNLDDFYWTPKELPDRIEDVTEEIMRCGRPATVFDRLFRKQPFLTDEKRERVCAPYGWDGIGQHCRHIADEIAAEVLREEVRRWEKDFGGEA